MVDSNNIGGEFNTHGGVSQQKPYQRHQRNEISRSPIIGGEKENNLDYSCNQIIKGGAEIIDQRTGKKNLRKDKRDMTPNVPLYK
jgi:hypothetical protein